jgi:uncharacterized membrane-anchored protein
MTTTQDIIMPRREVVDFLSKVPTVTATFWLIKILSTTIGETFADFLAVQVGLGTLVTDGAMITVLAVTLVGQLRSRRYVPWLYWLTVVLVSIVGTQITDFFTDILGISLYVSTTVFAVLLAIMFAVWWQQERTLAITAIDTPKRERFYWAAILTTFALGTAGGDLATEALSLGFRTGVLIFGGLILAVWGARKLGSNSVLTFWIAYAGRLAGRPAHAGSVLRRYRVGRRPDQRAVPQRHRCHRCARAAQRQPARRPHEGPGPCRAPGKGLRLGGRRCGPCCRRRPCARPGPQPGGGAGQCSDLSTVRKGRRVRCRARDGDGCHVAAG